VRPAHETCGKSLVVIPSTTIIQVAVLIFEKQRFVSSFFWFFILEYEYLIFAVSGRQIILHEGGDPTVSQESLFKGTLSTCHEGQFGGNLGKRYYGVHSNGAYYLY